MPIQWTAEELEEMRLADEEIDDFFDDDPYSGLTQDEIALTTLFANMNMMLVTVWPSLWRLMSSATW